MTGYLRSELIGRTSVELGIVSVDARTGMIEAVRETGRVRGFENQLRTKDGEIRDCLISGEIIDLAGKPHLLQFIASWGHWGSGPGEFKTPHALDIDSQGRLIVGDRGNNRLQVLELDGTYIGELKQFSRPSGLYITDDDIIYVADSESEFDERSSVAS